MANFQKALSKVLAFEGGWSDNPNDAGGATNKGITLATYRSVYGAGKTKADLRSISDEEVAHIYKKLYWEKVQGDLIQNQSLAELIFDFVVNSGIGKIKQMQGVTDCVADGIAGKNTLAVWNKLPHKCFDAIWHYRERYYKTIGTGKNQVFLKGWLKRLSSLVYV